MTNPSRIIIIAIAMVTIIAIQTKANNITDSDTDPESAISPASIILPLSAIYVSWFVVALVSGTPGFLFTSVSFQVLFLFFNLHLVTSSLTESTLPIDHSVYSSFADQN
jgi:hypothetical protein